jgi:hypothetical protein
MGPYHQILGLEDTWQKEENEIEEKIYEEVCEYNA